MVRRTTPAARRLVTAEEIQDRRRHLVGGLEQDGVAQHRQDDEFRIRQRLGDQLLADVRAVRVGGVDEVDPELDRSPDAVARRVLAIGVLIIVAVSMTVIARKSRFGRYIFATGGNPDAAELSGINTRALTVKIFALMGFLCGLAALIAQARLQSHGNDIGMLEELRVIAAAVIGAAEQRGLAAGTVKDFRSVTGYGVTGLVEGLDRLGPWRMLLLPDHATHPQGGVSLEAGISEMYDRMTTGRFKVANHLSEFFDEKGTYHRKDGLIVKERDDVLSAVRYGMMMKRHARAVTLGSHKSKRNHNVIAEGVDFDVF